MTARVIREAITAALKGEPLWVRILGYQLREGMSDDSADRLRRLLK